ncbi:glycosyl transferase [Polynucleobacter tropicus]|uniref:Glycosyl transferase n=1 Tax=Polynucleobacter tropicus TaxID=1743174 RepID=A0A6M9PZ71_9BURK|nr:glycosyl transferase [Polynucleobacter tropicus]QKM64055.1 glycosyl transferase [Polynucleobacter tropicus]
MLKLQKIEQFVTLFDSAFAPQGLALYKSLCRHVDRFNLWIICLDDEVYFSLVKLGLPFITLLRLSDLETAELRGVKKNRSKAEYCWTLTPFAANFVFDLDGSVDRVTYLDADLWFLRDPREIFDEFESSCKKVLITKHAFHPLSDTSAERGKFCVQFIIFSRSSVESVQKWWQHKCLEWCFARLEDGKFGDQKYLDLWPTLFGDQVHVLKNESAALGPWNALRFPWSDGIFYHFHSLRILRKNWVILSNNGYFLPNPLIESVYKPYLSDLALAQAELKKIGGSQKKQFLLFSFDTFKLILRGFRRYYLTLLMFLPTCRKIKR